MQTSSWVHVNQGKAGPRLFCLPYAGGGAAIYRLWQPLLPEAVVCPVQLPGRENRLPEPAITDIRELVQALIIELKPYLDVPFQFFGHSMGALLCFELARQLRREHLPGPTRLFLSAHRAPHIPHKQAKLHTLPDREFIEELKTLGGTPEAVLQNEELMQLLLPMLRADFTINETYQYKEEPPLNIPLAIMGAQEDTEVSVTDLDGWEKQTNQSFSVKIFPGDHFYIHSQQQDLIRHLRSFYR
jgi:medium-chain acyl-[acyl-carrier-protein] hydrolase